MRKIIFLLAFFAFFAGTASALYNDQGNDSCLTIYSDLKEYACPQGICEVILQIQNACGTAIPDLDLGLFAESFLLEKIQMQKVYQLNGANWTDITTGLTASSNAASIAIGKNFPFKTGWRGISIPLSGKSLKLVFNLLVPSDGEFIVAGQSNSNPSVVSVLDPIFRSGFYDFNITGNYTTFNTTVANSYCTLNAGQLQGYCDTNFLQPSPRVIKWYNFSATANYNSALVSETYNDNERNAAINTYDYPELKVDFNSNQTGRYRTYDLNFYLTDDGALVNLYVYVCNSLYRDGNFLASQYCSLARTITPAEISDSPTYQWYQFSIDQNKIKDANNITIIFYSAGGAAQKKYIFGLDSSIADAHSWASTNLGVVWQYIVSGEIMAILRHSASGTMYQYSTDGATFNYTDGNLLDANMVSGKIKIRSWLSRYSTSYDANVDSLDINYTNNRPPYAPALIQTADTNNLSAHMQWGASLDDENNAPILYHIKIGDYNNGNNIVADANTYNLYYDYNFTQGKRYYWTVYACDDANELPAQTNCGDYNGTPITFLLGNQAPSTPTLIHETNHQLSGIQIDLNWLASTDPESNPIRYHINIFKDLNLTADANTTDLNYYYTPTTGAYHWRVRACDNNYANNWNNCSAWGALDDFNITTPPVTTSDANNNVWQKIDANVHLSCTQSIYGTGCSITKYRLNSGSWTTYDKNILIISQGATVLDFNSTDFNGNVETTNTVNIKIDKAAPITSDSGCTAGWHGANQTITLICDDNSLSGCLQTRYRISNGAWQIYSAPFLLSADGNHQIDYNSSDNVNNQETPKTTYCAIDKTAPTIGATAASGFSIYTNYIKGTGTIVGGIATDNNSGIDTASCEYTIDGSNWLIGSWNTNHCEKTSIAISNGTIYIFNTRVKDTVANQGTGTATISYTGDTNAPTTTDNHVGGWHYADQTITLTCNDSGSGCVATQYRIDSGAWQSGTSILLNTDGNHQVDYNSTDNVGNMESTKTFWVGIEKATPSIPVLKIMPNQKVGFLADLNWNASTDPLSNPIRYHLNVYKDGNIVADANTVDLNYGIIVQLGSYLWKVRACNNSDGNYNNCSAFATSDFNGLINYPPSVPLLISESDQNNSNIADLNWNASTDPEADTIRYELNVFLGATPIYDINTSNTSYIISTTSGTYSWEVRACDNNLNNGWNNCSNWSPTDSFMVINPSLKMTIAYGATTINTLITDLNFTLSVVPILMSFSCDNTNWSPWETFSNIKYNFDMGGGSYGCAPKGEGAYTVYAAFTDGFSTFDTSDSIFVLGLDKNQTQYTAPEDTTNAPTALLTFAPTDVNGGLLILGILAIGAIAFFLNKRRKF